jgi:hypothetical protein
MFLLRFFYPAQVKEFLPTSLLIAPGRFSTGINRPIGTLVVPGSNL